MADLKMSAFTAGTTLAAADELPFLLAAGGPLNRKITWTNMCLAAPSGTAASPGTAYAADPNTGAFWVSAGIQAVTCDGLEVVRFSAPAGATPQLLAADGLVATPAYSYATDPDTGLWRSATNTIAMTLGAATRYTFTTTGITFTTGSQILLGGSASAMTVQSNVTTTAGPSVRLNNTVAYSGASAITQVGVDVAHTVNQTSTTGFTALSINTTQTAVGSGQQIAIDVQIAAVSKFSVAAKGALSFTPGTPASMGVTENDYNAAGFTDVTVVRLTGNAANTVITGFVAPLPVPVGGVAAGQLKVLVNITATLVTINHQDAGSAAANRIITSTGAAVVLTLDDTITLWYDSTTARWRQLTLLA